MRTSHLLHHLVLEWSRIAVPVLVFHNSRAAGLRENMVFQHLENVSRTLNSKCFPTLSIVCEKQMTLKILGKKTMTWRNPASFTEAPSLIAARSWFGCILYSTAKHWISLWASSSPFMLLARTSSLRSLCCIFQSLSMKRTTIANASPSLVLPSKITEKALLAAISDFTKSISFWWMVGMNSARWLRVVRRGPYFQEMVANCRLLKEGYLPSATLPRARIDRASCLRVICILLLLRLFLQEDPWYFDLSSCLS